MTIEHQSSETSVTDDRLLTATSNFDGSVVPQNNLLVPGQDPETLTAHCKIVIVHSSRLMRDCLSSAVTTMIGLATEDYCSLSEAQSAVDIDEVELLIVNLGSLEQEYRSKPIDELLQWSKETSVVIIGDSEDYRLIGEILSKGVRGYLPSSFDLAAWIHALRFVLAGGVFAPASAVINSATQTQQSNNSPNRLSLTEKQLAVIDAVRKGKANKVIAYELNMCESTVKVHVRAIMKKLKATNRTQVAYIANELFGNSDSGSLAGR